MRCACVAWLHDEEEAIGIDTSKQCGDVAAVAAAGRSRRSADRSDDGGSLPVPPKTTERPHKQESETRRLNGQTHGAKNFIGAGLPTRPAAVSLNFFSPSNKRPEENCQSQTGNQDGSAITSFIAWNLPSRSIQFPPFPRYLTLHSSVEAWRSGIRRDPSEKRPENTSCAGFLSRVSFCASRLNSIRFN